MQIYTPVAIYRQAAAYAGENNHCSFTIYCNDPCLAYFQLTDLNAPLRTTDSFVHEVPDGRRFVTKLRNLIQR
jgi:hypothetical protein